MEIAVDGTPISQVSYAISLRPHLHSVRYWHRAYISLAISLRLYYSNPRTDEGRVPCTVSLRLTFNMSGTDIWEFSHAAYLRPNSVNNDVVCLVKPVSDPRYCPRARLQRRVRPRSAANCTPNSKTSNRFAVLILNQACGCLDLFLHCAAGIFFISGGMYASSLCCCSHV